MSIARKVLGNTFIQFVGKLVTAVLSIFVLKMISGYLGTSGYGEYTTIYQYLAFFGIAADFGIFTITVKEMSQDSKRIPEILGNVLGLRTVLIVATMALAALSVFLIPNYAQTMIPMGVLIATLATILTLLNGTISTVLQVHLKMQYSTIGLVLGKMASLAYMAAVVYLWFTDDKAQGFLHLMWAGVIGNLVMLLITSYFVTRYSPIRYRFDYVFWKRIFLTSLPYGVALVLNNIYYRVDVILMTLILPHTQPVVEAGVTTDVCQQALCADTEVGLYGVGMRFLDMLIIIPLYYMNSILPTMSRFLEENRDKVRRIIQYSFDFLLATALPILVGGFILATPIIELISDASFLSGVNHAFGSDLAIRFLVFAMLFSFINALFSFTLVVLGRQKNLMYINGACVIFNLVGNFLVIPHYGFRGAAFTSILCELFILIFTAYAVKKTLGFNLHLRTAYKILLSAGMMGGVIWLGYAWAADVWFGWQLSVLVPLGALVYGGMLLFTRAITPEMRALLKKK